MTKELADHDFGGVASVIGALSVGVSGLPGATAGTRLAGATTGGPPTTGTWAVGDEVIDQTGCQWICTFPGTGLVAQWLQAGATPSHALGDLHVAANTQMLSAMPMTVDGFLYMDGGYLIELAGA